MLCVAGMSHQWLIVVCGLLLINVESINSLRCYWCVGVHCKHEGSGEVIDCNGSCYDMRATLANGLVVYTHNILQTLDNYYKLMIKNRNHFI